MKKGEAYNSRWLTVIKQELVNILSPKRFQTIVEGNALAAQTDLQQAVAQPVDSALRLRELTDLLGSAEEARAFLDAELQSHKGKRSRPSNMSSVDAVACISRLTQPPCHFEPEEAVAASASQSPVKETKRQRAQRLEQEKSIAEEVRQQAELERIRQETALANQKRVQKKESNARREERQQAVEEQRELEAQETRLVGQALHVRAQKSWLDVCFEARQRQQNAAALRQDSSQVLFDRALLSGYPRWDAVKNELKKIGCTVCEGVHDNEKTVILFPGGSMVWMDEVHGAQLKKGAVAGWAVSIRSQLTQLNLLVGE